MELITNFISSAREGKNKPDVGKVVIEKMRFYFPKPC